MTDFVNAARHSRDGRLLRNQQREATADHLAGLAAECALKAILGALGAWAGAQPQRPYRVHIDALWGQFLGYAHGPQARYLVPLSAHPSNPFVHWTIEHRYWNEGNIGTAAELSARWAACEACMLSLAHAQADGVVP
ncbi:MAG: hypothetical protein AB1758_28070 [Candidatus Eremiobacterota bacterium]